MQRFLCHSIIILAFVISALVSYSIMAQTQLPMAFAKADSIAALYPNHSVANLKILADRLTQPLPTEQEKFRAIYKWVCNNIETDYDFHEKNIAKRKSLQNQPEKLKQWNAKSNAYFFQKLLKEHKTICTGYAYLVRELSLHAGINCKIIDGYGRTPQANVGGTGIANHSWNAVELNHQWYLADATWSAGAVDPTQRTFIRQFSEAYFLTPPVLFALNHYPLDSAWLLLENKPTLSQFLNGPIAYKDAIGYQISPIFPDTFQIVTTKGKEITFGFSQQSTTPIDTLELVVVQGTNYNSFFPAAHTTAEKTTTITHTFSHKGRFITHVMMNGKYLFTYAVDVTK